MSAELLREAAALMRARAQAATPGPWTVALDYEINGAGDRGVVYDGYDGGVGDPRDAAHIASWHPAVALAVADWLDKEAALLVEMDEILTSASALGLRASIAKSSFPEAIAVARAYLGRDQ